MNKKNIYWREGEGKIACSLPTTPLLLSLDRPDVELCDTFHAWHRRQRRHVLASNLRFEGQCKGSSTVSYLHVETLDKTFISTFSLCQDLLLSLMSISKS